MALFEIQSHYHKQSYVIAENYDNAVMLWKIELAAEIQCKVKDIREPLGIKWLTDKVIK